MTELDKTLERLRAQTHGLAPSPELVQSIHAALEAPAPRGPRRWPLVLAGAVVIGALLAWWRYESLVDECHSVRASNLLAVTSSGTVDVEQEPRDPCGDWARDSLFAAESAVPAWKTHTRPVVVQPPSAPQIVVHVQPTPPSEPPPPPQLLAHDEPTRAFPTDVAAPVAPTNAEPPQAPAPTPLQPHDAKPVEDKAVSRPTPAPLFVERPVMVREEAVDRRFRKTPLDKLLREGSSNPGCVQLLGALFTALAETGPFFHKRDETLMTPPPLVATLTTQASTPNYSAVKSLEFMIRRVRIDDRLPDEWLKTAVALNKTVKTIDLAKLNALAAGVTYIDSAYFTLDKLQKALGEAGPNDLGRFRDEHLDRDITWPGLTLLELGDSTQVGKRKKPGRAPLLAPEPVAVLEWTHAPKDRPVRVIAKLSAHQFIELDKLRRGARLIVRGRLWELNKTATELEIRDALLFDDHEFSADVQLANPTDIASCPAARND